jgi:hypothetical protein
MSKYTEHQIDGVTTGYSTNTPNYKYWTAYPDNKYYKLMLLDVAADPTCIEVQDDTPVETFEDRLATSDKIMPRLVEDILDHLISGTPIPQEVKDKLIAKKKVRSDG